jgi:tetratricopeptide (TPR) repeat protein
MKSLWMVCLTTLALWGAACINAREALAIYLRAELDKVPIERVLTNLEDRAAEKPKDAALRFQVARAYAMGFASKKDEVEVQRRDQSLWYGYEPKNVPFQAVPTDDPKANKRAEEYLAKAIENYEAGLKLDPKHNVGRLGYAWCLDQAGQTDAAIEQYRAVIAAAWPNDQKLESLGPGTHPLTVEAAGYLIPLLKKQEDAGKEIAELQERMATIAKLPRAITPIAIPLSDNLPLSQIEHRAARVRFDADGSGLNRDWSWIKPTAGWLVYDRERSGKIESALQLFGNVTFWMFWQHGYEPLSALDDNRDGELRGAELEGLAIWCDANSNGISEAGEVKPLSEYGIVALSCSHEVDAQHVDRIEYSPRGVTFADGTTRPTYDVRLHLSLGE